MGTMHARLSEQGTAIGESALCPTCFPDPKHRAFADASDSVSEHVDCSGNEALSCVICGIDSLLAAYKGFVLALFERDPERVENAYRAPYGHATSWQAATSARERVAAALELDASDPCGSWLFAPEFDEESGR